MHTIRKKFPTQLWLLLAVVFLSSCNFEDVTVESLDKFSLKSQTDEGFVLEMDVAIMNPNGIALKMKRADMEVYLNDIHIGHAKIARRLSLPANEKSTHRIAVETTYAESFQGNLMSLGASALFGGLNMRLEGEIRGGTFLFYKKFPIDHKEKLDLKNLNINL